MFKRGMRFLLIFLFPLTITIFLIFNSAFAKDKIYTCKPVAAAVLMESGQIYSETLDTMDEEAPLLSVVPTSQFLISEEEGFFYKNNPTRDFESLSNIENLVDLKEVLKFEKIAQELDDSFDIKNLKVFYLPYQTFKDGKLESSSFKRIAINIDKNFTSEITIPQDMKDVSMYHFLRICDGDKENGPIQVNFEPGHNKALG